MGTERRRPQRTCVGCRQVRPVDELLRVTADATGALVVGRQHPGRGAWLCRSSPDCVERAARRGAFERALRRSLAPDAVASLAERLREEGQGAEGSAEPSC